MGQKGLGVDEIRRLLKLPEFAGIGVVDSSRHSATYKYTLPALKAVRFFK
jgi:hypothetical protein